MCNSFSGFPKTTWPQKIGNQVRVLFFPTHSLYFLMQPMWEHSTFIPKSSGLISTLCHFFLSSQSRHCFLVYTYTERGSHIAWVGRMGLGVVLWSDLYSTERDCASNSKPSSFCQPSQRTKQVSILYSWNPGSSGQLGFFSNITLSLVHYFCFLAVCLTFIHTLRFLTLYLFV